jgi:Putative prokaryotic signal transducing protein
VSREQHFVRLTVVANEAEAELLRSQLQFEGIDSVQRLTSSGAAATGGLMQTFGGEREILVRQEDLEVARALVDGS